MEEEHEELLGILKDIQKRVKKMEKDIRILKSNL